MGETLLSPEEIAALVSKMNQETDESIDSSRDLPEETSDQQLATGDQQPKTETRKVVFSPLENTEVVERVSSVSNMEKLGHMHFPLKIVLGEREMTIRELLDLKEDSVVILNTLTGEDASLLINDKFLAKGEIVVLNDCFALRISALDEEKETEIDKSEEEEILN